MSKIIGVTVGTSLNPAKFEGKSAYDIAKAKGFEGTETEWLDSLKGASGVYVGSGDMPPEYNVQIDIDGETIDEDSLATKEYVDSKIGDINAALLNIIAIQEGLIGGAAE